MKARQLLDLLAALQLFIILTIPLLMYITESSVWLIPGYVILLVCAIADAIIRLREGVL